MKRLKFCKHVTNLCIDEFATFITTHQCNDFVTAVQNPDSGIRSTLLIKKTSNIPEWRGHLPIDGK